jgi:uncharacterized protein YkwD
MKYFIFALLFVSLGLTRQEKNFSEEEKKKANTAADVKYMTEAEKQVIFYLNLCRLNPQKFLEHYVEKSSYVKHHKNMLKKKPQYLSTLKTTLTKLKPLNVLTPDKTMYENAECLAAEQSASGAVGHDRKKCKEEYSGECNTYGNSDPLDIVIDLLIDYDVPSYGHRELLLSNEMTGIGVSIKTHKTYRHLAVIDFK